MVNKNVLLFILDKNDINKTCRSCFEKMFLLVKIFCQQVIENKQAFGGTHAKDYSSYNFRDIVNLKLSMHLVDIYIYARLSLFEKKMNNKF